MKFTDFAEGVQILAPFAVNDQFCMQAEHDELWLGNPEWPLTDEQRARLEALGFICDDAMGWHVWT